MASKKIPHVNGHGDYDLEVVGESNYQAALKRITRGQGDVRHECRAEMYLENDNKYDHNAVRVSIDGQTVGYLSREMAVEMRRSLGTAGLNKDGQRVTIDAVIVGGGDKFYGVWLDMEVFDDDDEEDDDQPVVPTPAKHPVAQPAPAPSKPWWKLW